MKNSFVMSGLNASHDLPHDVSCTLWIDTPFASQQIVKSLAFDVLHDEKENSVGTFTEVVYINDVGMTDLSCGTCFTFEPRDSFAFL